MLETLIQQSPLSGTELEIAYRHEMTLDLGSGESEYWMVTRKSDGARLWLKAAKDSSQRKALAAECLLLDRLHCPGLAEVEENGTDSSPPYIAFKYRGEVIYNSTDLAAFAPLELLAFSLSVMRLVHGLENSKPPVALVRFDTAPLLISPMLKRPQLLGLGDYTQTASKEPHRQARESAWRLVSGALTAVPELAESTKLLSHAEQWVTRGPESFDNLHQAFNAAAFKLSTQDL
jgi:hypothetical protein